LTIPELVQYQVASNVDQGTCCLLIKDRPGRGVPTGARLLFGGLYWTAEDGLIEHLGAGEPLPAELLAHLQQDSELVVIPVTPSGVPAADFVLTIE
jgi:hypothetical protein